ncbi:MAG: hypothetical protein NTZ75_08480 [Euryarchaeota archaeon]|nr:hypothetical protein [Euryarchaeota archaeon]
MKKKIILGLGVIILLLVTFLAGCVKPTEYMVSMRDGVKLATDVYVPNKYTQPHGAILIRTPYNKDGLILLGMDWAKSGWPTVGQDMRGRFASEGINTVFRNEQTDGPDTQTHQASPANISRSQPRICTNMRCTPAENSEKT